MISNFDKCLFVHIPKTAGQSVEQVFLERAGLSWEEREDFLLKPNSDPKKGPPRLAHLTVEEYLQYGYLTQEELDSLYSFAVVRNPFDRLVSEYTYQEYPYSFKDFVFKHFPKEGEDDYERHHGHHRHVMPQWQFVCDQEGKLLVNDIVKFETLQQDFNRVSKAITGQQIVLPHRNKTEATGALASAKKQIKKLVSPQKVRKQHYSEYYDQETLDWLTEYYQKDLELFEYAFEKP